MKAEDAKKTQSKDGSTDAGEGDENLQKHEQPVNKVEETVQKADKATGCNSRTSRSEISQDSGSSLWKNLKSPSSEKVG